jgi:aminomethyltransferase
VVRAARQEVGAVTSGNFSPMLGHGIALALIDAAADPQPSSGVEVEQRGRAMEATVVTTPFVRPGQWAASL